MAGDKRGLKFEDLSLELQAALSRFATMVRPREQPSPEEPKDRPMTAAERQALSRKRERGGKLQLSLWVDEDDVVAGLQKHQLLTADQADKPNAIRRAVQEQCGIVTLRDWALANELIRLALQRGFLSNDEVDR
jgi:hypothetical protein